MAEAQQAWNVRLVAQIPVECSAVYVEGKYAYLGKGPDFRILDISKPTSPVLVGHLALTSPTYILGIHVSGSLAYIVAGYLASSHLCIIDVTNPSLPRVRSVYDTGGIAHSVFVSNGLAYVADGYSGLVIIDVTNPSLPWRRGSCLTTDCAVEVCVSNGFAYVADIRGLTVVDVSNPNWPFRRSFYDPGNSHTVEHVSYSNGMAVITSWRVNNQLGASWYGLWAVDVRSPDKPVALGGISGAGALAGDISISDSLAHVVLKGLRVYDTTKPSWWLTPSGYYPPPHGIYGLFARGNMAYAAMGTGGLWIFQYTGPYAHATRSWRLYR